MLGVIWHLFLYSRAMGQVYFYTVYNKYAYGTKLTIEGKEYTVIECNSTQRKVFATDTFQNAFDDNNSNNYATSTIATYLNDDYYKSLDPKIQSAIVETTIQQKVSSTGYEYSKK